MKNKKYNYTRNNSVVYRCFNPRIFAVVFIMSVCMMLTGCDNSSSTNSSNTSNKSTENTSNIISETTTLENATDITSEVTETTETLETTEAFTEPPTETPTETPTEELAQYSEVSNVRDYVINTSTKKFHLPSCSRKPTKNRDDVTCTREELIQQGYSPCGYCNP